MKFEVLLTLRRVTLLAIAVLHSAICSMPLNIERCGVDETLRSRDFRVAVVNAPSRYAST